jgi:hypothetical protein
MPESRLAHLERFYCLLDNLSASIGGPRRLADCNGRMNWPRAGIYFFFEASEKRTSSGNGDRVVRVGTHAITAKSGTSLWQRLSQHRGVEKTGGGNHRGSVFRLHVGTALLNSSEALDCPTWGKGSSATREIREAEKELEIRVSDIIRRMPFLWLGIEDPAGPQSDRAYTERNAIALLSNYNRPPLDPPSENWLGQHAKSEKIRGSGLWNSNHVDEDYDPAFLDRLEALIRGNDTP